MCAKTSEIPESKRKLIVKWRNDGKTYGEISKFRKKQVPFRPSKKINGKRRKSFDR